MERPAVTSRPCAQQVTRSLIRHNSRSRRSRVTPVSCSVGDWLLPSKWTHLSADMLESYRDRREAGQFLGRELQRTLPTLLQQHYQHKQQQQQQQQQQEHQQERPQPEQPQHDISSTQAATETSAAGAAQLDDIVVLGLVRGGMPVADAVARALHSPCDAFVVRKLGAPKQPEFGIGAVAEGTRVVITNGSSVEAVGATQQQLQDTVRRETRELRRRVKAYRGGRPHLPVAGKVAVLVDDGLATGITARAACTAVRAAGAAVVVLAVPVGCSHTVAELQAEGVADVLVCLRTPKRFRSVGAHYLDFSQTTDQEVVDILASYPHPHAHNDTQQRRSTHHSADPAAAAAQHAPEAGGSSTALQRQGRAGSVPCAGQGQQQQQHEAAAQPRTAAGDTQSKASTAAAAPAGGSAAEDSAAAAAAGDLDHHPVSDTNALRDQAAKVPQGDTSSTAVQPPP